ncbi:formate dehydrogenase accessory sulfurtransferase FdhD [Segnochrobactrum spirostomi]|uniref:Sulfur carrier protein FdhD n=1 Tax=Segnochrobactrum spirostomi TaxID=2608987 RepID=A0A6A7Y4W2_9HYPH|nr:formate dehydrogenase accessory sulfurtransferase FdhD [Segnochrobactrum spirostomi]MQT14204.1 formate dehydrogenase accessory sulfurtransferase FdhD [Segnochrobactrum spirostomi]
MTPPGAHEIPRIVWRDGTATVSPRVVPAEVPVAFTFNGTSHAVMMASPTDLEDFALGFALSEGLIGGEGEIESLEILEADLGEALGFEARMWIGEAPMGRLLERRRRIAGPTGCGLCGIESLDEAMRPVPAVEADLLVPPEAILAALGRLDEAQALGRATRAVHAAALVSTAGELRLVREDVGRHNALDKLIGATARAGLSGHDGFVLVTSRVSIEMVQKTAVLGAALLVAVSAPTALAVATADKAGLTLVAVARRDGFEIFTHPRRIAGIAAAADAGAETIPA